MKKKIKGIINFLCMFVILGVQALLHGSWSHKVTNGKTA